MSFKKKIDIILEAKKLQRLSINKIEQLIGVDGTIYKAYKDDREPADLEIVRNLIGRLGIRQEWWDKEWETGSKDIFGTSVQNKPAITENDPREVYRKVVEGETEYLLIPRTALEGSYRLVAIEQLTIQEKELERRNDELIRKDHQIEQLYELFKMIASGAKVELPRIEEAKKNVGV